MLLKVILHILLTGHLKCGNYCMLSPLTEYWYQGNTLQQIILNHCILIYFRHHSKILLNPSFKPETNAVRNPS